MAVSYKKLWKLLIDKDMKKKDLRIATGITTTALAKFGKKAYNLLCKVLKILSKKLNQNTKGNKNDGIESKKADSVDNGGGGVASRNTAVRSRLSARVHQKRARQP